MLALSTELMPPHGGTVFGSACLDPDTLVTGSDDTVVAVWRRSADGKVCGSGGWRHVARARARKPTPTPSPHPPCRALKRRRCALSTRPR